MNLIKKAFLLLIVSLVFRIPLDAVDTKFLRVLFYSNDLTVNNIQVHDQYVIINNDRDLHIINASNIWSPYVEAAFSSSFPITDVLWLGHNKFFVCSNESTNEITEIDSLNRYGKIFFPQRLDSYKAQREGSILYTIHRENGLEIFNLGQGLLPHRISSYSDKWGIHDFEVRYPVVHAINDFGYVYIDVTDMSVPMALGYNYEIVDASVIEVYRNIVWIGAGSTLIAIDHTDSTKPMIVNRYRFSSRINALEVQGNKLFVGLNASGLRILDISNPIKITEKNSFYIRTGVKSIDVYEDHIFLGTGNTGWYVLEYR